MQLRTRRLMFWALIPCFLVGGTAIVLYSQGYRADLETREVTKVGAFYVRGYPREAAITIDGEPLNTGSWWPLQSGTLLGSMVPGTYRLHAEAPGYRDWDADIVVRATLVTERKSLTLFPVTAAPVPLPGGVVPARIETIGDPDALALGTAGDNARVIVGGEVIPGSYVGNADGRVVTLATVTRGKATSTLLRFQTPGQDAAATAAVRGDAVIGVFDDSVLVRESERLVAAYAAADGERETFASSSPSSTVGAVLRTGGFDAWAEDGASGSALRLARRDSGQEPLSLSLPAPVLSLQASGDRIGVLDAAGSLWLVDPESGGRREVAHRAGFAAWNPDGTAVLALVDGELEVVPLKQGIAHGVLHGILGDPKAAVGRVAWYPDDEHVIVEIGDELAFVDIIDGAASEQHADRVPRPADWTFDRDDLTLYLLDAAGAVSSYVFPD